MQKRYMTLNCTQVETTCRLKQQLRVYPPKGIVEENHFKIYKQAPGLFIGRRLEHPLFCFYGNYQQSGKCTHIAYRILPGFSIFLFFLLLSLSTLFMLYQVIFRDEPIISVVIILSFLLVYFLITQVQKQKCIADFEKQLSTRIFCKNRRHL